MEVFCTIMTVVPIAGMDWSPPPGNAGTSGARRSARAADDVALGHLDHVPHTVHAVALGGQRLRALEGVQRTAVVGDLLGAVRDRDRAERAQALVGRARNRVAAR